MIKAPLNAGLFCTTFSEVSFVMGKQFSIFEFLVSALPAPYLTVLALGKFRPSSRKVFVRDIIIC